MTDTLIVGSGLAGCFVAKQLRARGHSLKIVLDGAVSSSQVAAGIINPVTGKRFGYDENYLTRYQIAVQEYSFYSGALRPMSISRIVSDTKEIQHWRNKATVLSAQSLIHETSKDQFFDRMNGAITDENAIYLRIESAALVHTAKVLDAFHKQFVREAQAWSLADVRPTISRNTISLNGEEFRRVVFCEGWKIRENPLFAHLPFMFAKGQLLQIRFDDDVVCSDIIVHNGKFLAPQDDGSFLYGATYEWNEIDTAVTQRTTDFLSDSLRQSFTPAFQVLAARAGVRPIMSDLKPIMGRHPEYDNVFVLNGLGSKGALLAPSLARDLVQFMDDGTEVAQNLDVQRFFNEATN